MLWQPPWTNRGQDDIKRDVQTRNMAVDTKAPGHTRTLTQPLTSISPSDGLQQFKKDAAARVGDEASSDEVGMCGDASVFSNTENMNDSEVSMPAPSQHSD